MIVLGLTEAEADTLNFLLDSIDRDALESPDDQINLLTILLQLRGMIR